MTGSWVSSYTPVMTEMVARRTVAVAIRAASLD